MRAIIAVILSASQALAECPPNAHVDRVEVSGHVETTYCSCNNGYEKHGGACVRITSMRAQTRTECVRQTGTQLKTDLDQCTTPWLSFCFDDPSANEKVAICFSTGALIKFDPSKVTVLGALIACGIAFPDATRMVRQCPQLRDSCLANALSDHKQNVASCSSASR